MAERGYIARRPHASSSACRTGCGAGGVLGSGDRRCSAIYWAERGPRPCLAGSCSTHRRPSKRPTFVVGTPATAQDECKRGDLAMRFLANKPSNVKAKPCRSTQSFTLRLWGAVRQPVNPAPISSASNAVGAELWHESMSRVKDGPLCRSNAFFQARPRAAKSVVILWPDPDGC